MSALTAVDVWGLRKAEEVALQSPDPHRKVGAVFLACNGRAIRATGWNRIPSRLERAGVYDDVNQKLALIVHAEEAAISRTQRSLDGTTLYCTRMTCHECAKLVVDAGVIRVVAPVWDWRSKWNDSFEAAVEIYNRATLTLDLVDERDYGQLCHHP